MKYIWSILGAWLLCFNAVASELDLYLGEPQDVPARIMLLVDTSGSMGENLAGQDCAGRNAPTPCITKMEILKDTLSRFIDADNLPANAETRWPDHYSVGLSHYTERGAIIRAEVRRLGDTVGAGTHRQALADIVAGLPASGGTPLISSYLETIEFLEGGRAISGGSYNDSIAAAWQDRAQFDYAEGMPTSLTCDRSNDHLVVLTDGLSTTDNTSAEIVGCVYQNRTCYTTVGEQIRNRVSGQPAAGENSYLAACPANITTSEEANDPDNVTIWQCANALADSIVDKSAPDNISGIRTHTIAYSLGGDSVCEASIETPVTAADFLCNWAMEGGGKSYVANDAEGLANAFKGLLGEFKFFDSFAAAVPGVSVNQSNRFSYLNDVFYSVFKPSDRRVWYGNLKKYQLDYQNGAPLIKGDGTGNIDANRDGFFDSDAKSFWFDPDDYDPTVTTDADNVVLGGAALRIPPKADRSLFTSLSNNTTFEISDANAPTVAAEMLPGAFPDEDTRTTAEAKITDVVNWLRGDDALDINNEWARVTLDLPEAQRQEAKLPRTLYGAPLHSSPVLVNYTSTTTSGNDAPQPLEPDDQDNLVFVSTNDGKLYAVDATTGNEKLAFVPGALLKRSSDNEPSMIEQYYDAARENAPGDFIYGLDSTWTVWRQDVNGDGNITSSNSNDFVYLYGGMRRGGRNYYGLDMTEANDATPGMEQLFVLEGGVQNSETADIGQTWSEPVLGMIKYNGVAVVVMVVGGGYDTLYDSGAPGINVTPQGAQLYIVAAHNRNVNLGAGNVLWWASSSNVSQPGNHHVVAQLTDSIPSTVKVLDKDGDGYLDHIYVADLGGTLMRFDINNANTGHGNLISNTGNVVVAELGEDAVTPLSDDDRRFFYPPSIALMKDTHGKHVAIAIGSGKITDPKDNTVDERYFFIKDYAPFGLTVTAEDNPIFSYPLELQSEKMLGSPLIVGGRAFFSTYYWGDNSAASEDQCRPVYGRAALYMYDPTQDEVEQLGKAYPQSLAGTLTTILQTIPEQRDADGELVTPGGSDFIGIGGTSAFDLPDVDLGNIRKTRWKQCPESGECK